jgi:uncharacterized protein YciI
MYFLCRLIPPRSTFPADITAAEAETMKQHVVYWTGLLAKKSVIAFGPVADPKGTWGMGIVDVRDETELRELQENDPARRIGMKYEAYPMPRLVHAGAGMAR